MFIFTANNALSLTLIQRVQQSKNRLRAETIAAWLLQTHCSWSALPDCNHVQCEHSDPLTWALKKIHTAYAPQTENVWTWRYVFMPGLFCSRAPFRRAAFWLNRIAYCGRSGRGKNRAIKRFRNRACSNRDFMTISINRTALLCRTLPHCYWVYERHVHIMIIVCRCVRFMWR